MSPARVGVAKVGVTQLQVVLLRVAVLALVTSEWSACSQWKPPRVGEPIPTAAESSEESAYQAVFSRYTSHAEIYAGLDTRLFAAATFQSVPFREARLKRQAAFQNQPREWFGTTVEKELQDAAQVHELMLGVHFNDNRYEDMDKANSIWHIALVTSAGEVTPVLIQRVGRADLNLASYYPYLDLFWTAYRVRFPRLLPGGGELAPPGTQHLTLRMASSLGKVEMVFPAQ